MVKFKKDSFSGKRGSKPNFLNFNKTNGGVEKNEKTGKAARVEKGVDVLLDLIQAKAKKKLDGTEKTSRSSWEKPKSATGGKMSSAPGGKMKPAPGGKMQPALGGKMKPVPQGKIQYNTVNSTSDEMKYDKDYVKKEVYNFQVNRFINLVELKSPNPTVLSDFNILIRLKCLVVLFALLL